MRCVACGEQVGEADRYCPRCGSPVLGENRVFQDDFLSDTGEDDYREEEKEPVVKERRRRKKRRFTQMDQAYSEHLYRDSFYASDSESRSHSLMITLVTLLILALGVGCFLLFYYRVGDKLLGRTQQERETIEITLDMMRQDADGSTGIADIVIIGEEDTVDPRESAGEVTLMDEATNEETQSLTETKETQKPQYAETVLRQRIEEIMMQESTASAYAVHISDLSGSREYAAGEAREAMYATGTITVPILYAAAYLLDHGQITLNDQLTYVNSIGGRGEYNPESREGRAYALSYYLTTMLTYNDNNCMNCMLDYLGIDTINEICQSQGMHSTKIERLLVTEVTDGKENYVSAQDLTRMVRELYNGKFSVIGRDFMKRYFKISEDDANYTLAGMAQGPDTADLFLNQNGKGDTRFAETAVIGDDQCSYIISILCRGDYGFLYEDAVKDVSSYVWEALHEAS